MSPSSILGAGGAIAGRLGNYEPRPEQLRMADAVARAIAERKHLMVEAGTGVGKSFAYLVPAIAALMQNKKCRVVVSTQTIGLQEQLLRKDIPFLQKVFDKPFEARLVKGRSNYLSKRRLRLAGQRVGNLLFDTNASDQLSHIERWAQQTRDGSRSDLRFRPLPTVWDLVESDAGNCMGRRCKDHESCFYYKARRNLDNSQLLVVNHALFFCDLALRSLDKEVSILPDYDVAILDEAHTIEDVASDSFGLQITRGQIDFLLAKLLTERRGTLQGLLSLHDDPEAHNQVYSTRAAAHKFFLTLLDWKTRADLARRAGSASETLRIRDVNILPDTLSAELTKLAHCLDRLSERLDDEESQTEVDASATRCHELAASLTAWMGQHLPDQVYWLENSGPTGQKIALASAPIDVAPILKEKLFDAVPSVILTSATLSVGGHAGFDYCQRRIGFSQGSSLQLGSPFNYREQAELHLFRNMPEPSQEGFDAACLEKIKEYTLRTRGRAFVLFTSNGTLQRAARDLKGWFHDHDMQLLSQADGMPANQMLERFRLAPSAVLFGVDTFWQGVDVQGDALSNVIITKLPFTPPDRPLIEARSEAIRARNGEPFWEYSVPQAIIKLKQGFGRLIRTRADRGIVVILDPRILTKSYGRLFRDALPPCRTFIDGTPL